MDLVTVDIEERELAEVEARYRGTPAQRAIDAAVGALREDRMTVALADTLRFRPGGYSRTPLLAVAPPWARVCHVTIRRDRSARFWAWRGIRRWRMDIANCVSTAPDRRRWRGRTRMPVIPGVAEIRPGALVLWEAEGWEMQLPRDPALLEPIAGDLYHAYFRWNLTPFERKVLGG